MKRYSCLLLILLLLSGCTAHPKQPQRKMFEATYLTLFDTVTTIKGMSDNEESFRQTVQVVYDDLEEYHRLFDIYNTYEGLNNLKTVNDNAGIAPVTVDRRIIDLLLSCQAYQELTNGRVNAAMGSVLQLWHKARSSGIQDPVNAKLPDKTALLDASTHSDFSAVMIDEAASSVYISDPNVSLDVGAVAKGWSAQRVAENAPEGLLISVGSNVCATGPKDSQGTPWVVGIQNPDGGDYLHTVYLTKGSVVTSGDYQRSYSVDGVSYHHIIDPDTLYPGTLWRSVTVICDDSGTADALSTALFLLPQTEGQALLEICDAEALWVDSNGNLYYSPGFQSLIRT